MAGSEGVVPEIFTELIITGMGCSFDNPVNVAEDEPVAAGVATAPLTL